MLRMQATVSSDSRRSQPSALAGDWRDAPVHHRYYGSSACNGGERLAETRRGPRPRHVHLQVNLFGF